MTVQIEENQRQCLCIGKAVATRNQEPRRLHCHEVRGDQNGLDQAEHHGGKGKPRRPDRKIR